MFVAGVAVEKVQLVVDINFAAQKKWQSKVAVSETNSVRLLMWQVEILQLVVDNLVGSTN